MLRAKITKSVGQGVEEFMLDVEFEVRQGFTILFGASGSGKSTTLRAIAGILTPDAGRITIDEEIFFDAERDINVPARQRRVGYVFQNLALFPHLSARENIEFGMTGLSKADKQQRATAILTALHIAHTASRKPKEISGGEAQRVALARALSCAPKILLLDEPLSAIDEATKAGIIHDLKLINRDLRLPILYVTHSRDEAITLGERVIVMEGGRVVDDGEPLEVFRTPVSHSVARLTGVENIFTGVVLASNAVGGILKLEVQDENGACRIDIPYADVALQTRLTLAVPANDILLATQPFQAVSARNLLRGQLLSIEDHGNRTVAQVKSGVLWRVNLTRQAVEELRLSPMQEVWLAFKTHSCYRLDE
ncbi:MAG: ATP-binding cassette domain-containing protein [Acidobacteria bacterium]|nr:ATP-binding cassette domain-containing protein [Acidobacteriota bacterium]